MTSISEQIKELGLVARWSGGIDPDTGAAGYLASLSLAGENPRYRVTIYGNTKDEAIENALRFRLSEYGDLAQKWTEVFTPKAPHAASDQHR